MTCDVTIKQLMAIYLAISSYIACMPKILNNYSYYSLSDYTYSQADYMQHNLPTPIPII